MQADEGRIGLMASFSKQTIFLFLMCNTCCLQSFQSFRFERGSRSSVEVRVCCFEGKCFSTGEGGNQRKRKLTIMRATLLRMMMMQRDKSKCYDTNNWLLVWKVINMANFPSNYCSSSAIQRLIILCNNTCRSQQLLLRRHFSSEIGKILFQL